jgi:hypothetical protein
VIHGAPELIDIGKVQPPAVAKIWRSFQRPVTSSIVISRDFHRIFGSGESFDTVVRSIVAMTKDESTEIRLLNQNLADGLAIVEHRGERYLGRVRH